MLADRARVLDPPYSCDGYRRFADRCTAMGVDRHRTVCAGRCVLRRNHVVPEHEYAEIIGVSDDGKYADLNETPQPYLYLPLSQEGRSEVTLIVTTTGDAGALLPVVRKTLRQMSPIRFS